MYYSDWHLAVESFSRGGGPVGLWAVLRLLLTSRGHESLNISCYFITCKVGSVLSCSEEKQRKVTHYTEPIAKVVDLGHPLRKFIYIVTILQRAPLSDSHQVWVPKYQWDLYVCMSDVCFIYPVYTHKSPTGTGKFMCMKHLEIWMLKLRIT